MTSGRHRKPNLASTVGVICLGTCVISAAWTGHWEWLAAGVGLLIILAGVGAYMDAREQ